MSYVPLNIVESLIGGGGGSYPGFSPPSSPSAYDNEFTDNTTGFTTWDEDSELAVSPQIDGQKGLFLSKTDGGTATVAGLFRSAPGSGDFSVHALVSVANRSQNFSSCGIFIGGNLASAPDTAGIETVAQYSSAGSGNRVCRQYWSDYNSFGSETVSALTAGLTSVWLRLRYNSSLHQYAAEWSTEGKTWQPIALTVAPGANVSNPPSVIGVQINNDSAVSPFNAYVKHFRVTLENDFHASVPSADYE